MKKNEIHGRKGVKGALSIGIHNWNTTTDERYIYVEPMLTDALSCLQIFKLTGESKMSMTVNLKRNSN
jgi:hypothetical protein